MSTVEVRDVSIRFPGKAGKKLLALDRISLDVREGEFISLIGHSGCGKSTLLNLIAGLLKPTSGSIVCAGAPVKGPGPDRAMVFQSHALLPWMTCFQNIELAVKQVFKRSSRAEITERADAALNMVHLAHAGQNYPYEISGGMKQRVGIARALATEPRVLLMDEPFGALDALTRSSLQDELVRIVEATKSTVVMVTHDIDEAILLSDRVVMMTRGPAAHIGEIVDIELARPRDRIGLATDRKYVAYRKELLEFLYAKQDRILDRAQLSAVSV
ncbi:bicarbonate transport ATP-binding protein CmpD [Variibacter gotjawalensis]|uniref:Bicarbonate transport ATP-binding protein CmpD n=1 Tax=Variibacter gotjawalensis TaxID=1333996 RepID=A0A0S3Q011_9BRAD|nr:ABC transporter ATP-binding protein [Variibacter gotjawalensis]NIK47372.1 nitrate/nitrite transport system ATP-binding protein [Variibacter gotjawalensis]RZS49268.1 nitrate/nitrite transport system ATP-binding protein [Variibacter gotjawalensis]BAT61532.1 bicarbonate transport ATP-binding protein CmpD [Variibacter gotjawalensis]